MMFFWLSMVALLLALVGCVHLAAAAVLAGRFARYGTVSALDFVPAVAPGVTVLKPLHGADVGLYENLLSFCRQDYGGAIQIVFGVADANDAAVGVAEHLRKVLPRHDIALVVDATVHGSNRKVSNLINMTSRIKHGIVVIADSDIRVGPHYLSRVVAALQAPGVGAVTCVYRGLATVGGLWSRLFALGIDAVFLPNLFVGLGLGMAKPCFGSTIALRRETLDAIGGGALVADTLADDYALGAAVRAKGYGVAIPPFAIAHVCGAMTAGGVWRQEMRWARTICAIDPAGYAGSLLSYPLPWALLAALLGGMSSSPWPGLAVAIAAAVGRIALLYRIGKGYGFVPRSYWLVPVRELLSFAIFVASFFGRDVNWRGRRFRVGANGKLLPDRGLHET